MDMYRVDPIAIAQSYGIEILGTPFIAEDGSIEKTDNKIILKYNTNSHPNRQRFTIAHELGHFIAGHLNGSKKMFRDQSKNFTIDNYDIQEVEANKIAAQILMPKETVEHLIKDIGISTIDELSTILDVSTGAMHYRLKNLGII